MKPFAARRIPFRQHWLAILRSLAIVAIMGAGSAADQMAPTLRIETVRHGSHMNGAGIDPAGHWMITVGDDKTARIWSLPELRPLFVLRPAIGPKAQGALYAVAVSPDGTLAAVGGFRAEILVFDMRTRAIVHRWTDLTDSVMALAFSPDGARLAVGTGGQGIRILRTDNGTMLSQDQEYGGSVYGLDFAHDGRLAVASLDGGVRLYDPLGNRQARTAMQAGHRPTHVRFTPDGKLLAVGFNDVMAVEIRGGAGLEPRGRPSVAGLTGRSLELVAWSGDGQTLYAGGATIVQGTAPVFAWSAAGSGARRIVERGFAGQVAAIEPLPDGKLAVGSLDADLAVAAADGHRVAEVSPLATDFEVSAASTHPSRRFRLSPDGTMVEWVPFAVQPRYDGFDAGNLVLGEEAQPRPFLADWTAEADGLRVTDWDGGREPRLNGTLLALEPNERAESVAVRNGRLLLGTQWQLRLFDAAGHQAWATRLPAPAWRVNQSPDGRLAVAALGDGTLRWYRVRDGQELLAAFLTRDGGRWIAFTPSGYYAASPGGEDLIGWHVNRGADQVADFFPASRFRDRFYRPDVTRLVLATLDEAAALRQADLARGAMEAAAAPIMQDLPPVLTILSPVDGTEVANNTVEVQYAVRSPSGRRLRDVRVLIDGLPVTLPAQGAPDGQRGQFPQPAAPDAESRASVAVPVVPGHDMTIALLADTETRTSEPARISLRGPVIAPKAPAAPRRNLFAPRLNALLVGVSAYKDPALRHGVEYAASDAAALQALLERQRDHGFYKEINIKLITDADATREGIVEGLDWLQEQTTSNDVVIVFMAGHGVADPQGRVFFLPVGANTDHLSATALSQSDLLNGMSNVVGRKVAFLDFCHSGGAVLPQNTRGNDDVDMAGLLNQLREPGSGLIVFAAATSREPAIQLDDLHHGAFTIALLEALGGKADMFARGAVGTAELNAFIPERVRALTSGKQHPIMERADDLPDFPLVVTK